MSDSGISDITLGWSSSPASYCCERFAAATALALLISRTLRYSGRSSSRILGWSNRMSSGEPCPCSSAFCPEPIDLCFMSSWLSWNLLSSTCFIYSLVSRSSYLSFKLGKASSNSECGFLRLLLISMSKSFSSASSLASSLVFTVSPPAGAPYALLTL